MSAPNADALALIDTKITSIQVQLGTARMQLETHQENAAQAQALIEIHEDTIRRLEGSKYLLLSQPPQEVHPSE